MHIRLWRALWLLPFAIFGDGYLDTAPATAKSSCARSSCVVSPQDWLEALDRQGPEKDPCDPEWTSLEGPGPHREDHQSHGFQQETIVEARSMPCPDERVLSEMLEMRHRMESVHRPFCRPARPPAAVAAIIQPGCHRTAVVLGCSSMAR